MAKILEIGKLWEFKGQKPCSFVRSWREKKGLGKLRVVFEGNIDRFAQFCVKIRLN